MGLLEEGLAFGRASARIKGMAASSFSITLSVMIRRDAEEVYEFVRNPENLPVWAAGLGDGVRREGEGWKVRTPDGEARLRFVERNVYRICDHYVTPPAGAEIHVPMRVLENGDGAEVLFTLFQQEMTPEAFERDRAAVTRDLAALKAVLE